MIGRFIARDINSVNAFNQSEINRYIYAKNNPISMYDPIGRNAIENALLYVSSHQEALAVAFGLATVMWYVAVLVDVDAPPRILPWIVVDPGPAGGGDPEPEPPDDQNLLTQALRIITALSIIFSQLGGGTQRLVEGEPLPNQPSEPEPTETQVPYRRHISLGLSNINGRPALADFTSRLNHMLNPLGISVYLASQWHIVGLSTSGDLSAAGFGFMFSEATSRAEHIHFNLEGISLRTIDYYIDNYGGMGNFEDAIYFTAAELYLIRSLGL